MTRRRLLLLVALYLVLAASATVTSRVLDKRQKFPTGLTRTFYEGSVSTGVARFQHVSTGVDLAFVEADRELPRRFFGVRWEGIWYRQRSEWVDLYAGADDVVKIELDDQVVLERNGARDTGARRATLLLPAGAHRLVVTYEQSAGNFWLYFWVARAGSPPRTVHPETLFPRAPSPRRFRANHNLFLLRRTAASLWVAPPLAALLWAFVPWARGFTSARESLVAWRRRNRDTLRHAVSWRGLLVLALYLPVAIGVSVTSRAMDARQKFPIGLTRTFYEGDVSTGVARPQQLSTRIDLAFLDADPSLPRRAFGVRWEGIWYRDRGEWVDLYVGADGVVRVELDDQLVLERKGAPSTRDQMARFPLPAGVHRLNVTYDHGGDDYWFNFRAARAGSAPRPVDPESLFPRSPSPRRIRTNHNLLLLRRTATVLWVVPPVLALLWAFVPWRKVTAVPGLWRSWLRRNQDNLRLARFAPAVDRAPTRIDWRFAALYAAVVVLFLGSMWRLYDPDTGFTSLIAFGRQFEDRRLPAVRALPHVVVENSGYDGQFYAQLALDPLLRNPDLKVALDSIALRSRRILVPWTAFVFGLGRPNWILQVYAIQNVAFWLMLAWVLLRWLPPDSIRNWLAWCGCLLCVGSIMSVRLALTDLPGASIMALGLAVAETGRPYLAGGLLGLSGLARETNLIAILAVDWWGHWQTHRVRVLLTLLLILSPLALWMFYLQAVLGPQVWPVDQGGTFMLPFGGVVEFLQRASRDVTVFGWQAPVLRGLVALLGVGTQGLYLLWRVEWHRPWWRVGIAYAAFFMIFPMPVLEGNPGAFVRVLLPLTLAFNVLIPQSRWFWPLFVLGNATIVQGLQSLSLLPW